MSSIEGKLLEQDMVQRICGQFDPAIPATWSQFRILITPYIERETMLQLKSFRTVFDIFRSKNLITLGYYERLTKIVGEIHAPCARLMARMQEEIEQKLEETDKEDIRKCKENASQGKQETLLNSKSAADLEADMISKLSGEIGPSHKHWGDFIKYVDVYVKNAAAVESCKGVDDVFNLLNDNGFIQLGNYETLVGILKRIPAAPAKRIAEDFQQQITQTLKANETTTAGQRETKRKSNEPPICDNDGGAKFRKPIDNTRSAQNTDALSDANKSVGKIIGRETYGTGFRVGSKYILTCWHVVTDLMKGNFGNKEEKNLDNDSVSIQFNYKSGGHNPCQRGFHFEGKVLCYNEDLDYAVLELKDEGTAFPPHIKYFEEPTSSHDIYFIGHPGGSPMKEDPGIRIFDRTDQLEDKIVDLNAQCQNRYATNDYRFLLEKDKILFHCSFRFGASGSPGIVVANGKATAVLMLQGGAPQRWHRMTDEERAKYDISNLDLIEYGVGMKTIRDDMVAKNTCQELRNDIFNS